MSIDFISYTKEKGFYLSLEAESFFDSISQMPIAVLFVVGKYDYRAEKNLFINRVILDKRNGSEPKDRSFEGLWLWGEPLDQKNPEISNNIKVLLISSDIFKGRSRISDYTAKIGIFSLILSSYVIYTNVELIDEKCLEELSEFVRFWKEILGKQEENIVSFPSFLLVLMNCIFEFTSTNSKQYFEESLNSVRMLKESANRRKDLQEILSERDCITFFRPIIDEFNSKPVESLENKLLNAEFIAQTIKAREKIFSSIKPKKINGRIITAGVFLQMVKTIIPIINEGRLKEIRPILIFFGNNQSNDIYSG